MNTNIGKGDSSPRSADSGIRVEIPGQPDPESREEEDEEQTSGAAYTLKRPIMGGIQRQSEEESTPWTGGEPNAEWTGLVEPNPSSIIPTQFRPIKIGSSTKSKY